MRSLTDNTDGLTPCVCLTEMVFPYILEAMIKVISFAVTVMHEKPARAH